MSALSPPTARFARPGTVRQHTHRHRFIPLFPADYVVFTPFYYGIGCQGTPGMGKLVVMVRPSVAIDAVSRAIIEQLQADGRRSYASIGTAVGLSEAAVRQRVQKLVDAGVMQIVAVTDPMQIGMARQAMIAISVTGGVEAVAEELTKIDEVDYIVITAGSFDLMAEIVVEDDRHLLELVSGRIRAIPGVERTETFLYLKLVKQTYNWGAR
jgi:Lrp/AsnC family transcriptional regulator, regulator for asnA, asnC and gidA